MLCVYSETSMDIMRTIIHRDILLITVSFSDWLCMNLILSKGFIFICRPGKKILFDAE